MCVCVCLYVEPVSRSKDYVQSLTEIGSVVCLYIPVSPSVRETEGILLYMPLGASLFFFFLEDVPLVEFMYLVFTRKPIGVPVGNSGLCCCVLCLSSAIMSLRLLIYDVLY